MSPRPFILFCLMISSLSAPSKEVEITLHFQPLFNGQKLVYGKDYVQNTHHDTIRISKLEFYISGIEFLLNNAVVGKEEHSYHLLNSEDTSTFTIHCHLKKTVKFDHIRFNLGIDSTTNVSGVHGGDLDPTKGMYWTWQSGYINFKMEGTSSASDARLHEFTFHIGGYSAPNATLQTMTLATNSSPDITIMVNTENFTDRIDLKTMNHIMIPGKDAITLAAEAASIFSIAK